MEFGTLQELETYARISERRGSCFQVAIKITCRCREPRKHGCEAIEDRITDVAAVRGRRCGGIWSLDCGT